VRGGGGSVEERKREQGGLRFQGALRSWASCVGGGGSAEERAGRVIRSGAGLDQERSDYLAVTITIASF
jgi:hypothetical protein